MLEEYWVHSRATFEGFGAKLLAVYTRSAGKKSAAESASAEATVSWVASVPKTLGPQDEGGDADEIRTDRCAIVFGNALLPDVLRSRVDNFAPLSFYA
jgi:hypothetical protein